MTSWSRDGRFILVDRDPVDIWVIPTEPGSKPFPFIDGTPYRERAQFSPDGRWVAYESNESGRTEIYVRPLSGSGPAAPAAGQWQVSTAGGAQARWSPDGKGVYWVGPDSTLMTAAIVVTGATVEPGAPVALFPTRIPGGWNPGARAQYAVAPDGRFLINTLVGEASSPPITIVQHWRGFGR